MSSPKIIIYKIDLNIFIFFLFLLLQTILEGIVKHTLFTLFLSYDEKQTP